MIYKVNVKITQSAESVFKTDINKRVSIQKIYIISAIQANP